MSGDSIAKAKSMAFAQRMVRLYQYLTNEKREVILSKQLLRSGTSIGANITEAIYGSSKRDFAAKLRIALKECAETLYWLELLYTTGYLEQEAYQSLFQDCDALRRILSSAVKNAE